MPNFVELSDRISVQAKLGLRSGRQTRSFPIGLTTLIPADSSAAIRYPVMCSRPVRGSDAFPSMETARLHHAARRRGACVAALGTRAAAGDAGGRISARRFGR